MPEKIKMTSMHNAGSSMQSLLPERRSESDGFMESEALKIAEKLVRLIAEMAAGRQILRQTDVRLTKLRSAPRIIYPLNGLVLLASCVQTPDQVILQSRILNFRFANAHDNISFVHEGREHVVFSTAQDKIAWLDPFVEMRPNLFSNTRLEFSATVSLLSLSVCSVPGSLSSH
jgi:hypothetical protein